MDSYIHALLTLCATMATGVVVIGCIDLIVFGVLALRTMVRDELDL